MVGVYVIRSSFYRSVLLAGVMGFTGVMTEATGRYSQKAFGTIGMLKVK